MSGSDVPSFDPRTWTTAPPGAPIPAPAPAARHRDGPPAWLPGAACAAILVAGAGLSLALRDRAAPHAAAPVAIAAAPPAAVAPGSSRRTLVLAGVADLAPTLASIGLAPDAARAATGAAASALAGMTGELRLALDLAGAAPPYALTRLEATREDGAGVVLSPTPDGGFASKPVDARLTSQVKVVRGEMDATSFYNAAVTAGVTDSLIDDFAKAFAYDFDFQRDIRPGDTFEAAFEQKYNPEGREVGQPSLLYVAMTTAEKSRALYRFKPPGDAEAGWFDGNGNSTVRALMRTPVDGARITSQFGMRMHPVLGFMKMHKGIDFAAPIGTPIYAAGDGVVEWAAMKGPNGNLTILQHDNGWETYYLHQSRFMPGVVAGARVHQGQEIGAIGTTGRSTGPHLHYEVHINKEAVDPAGIKSEGGRALDAGALVAFRKERDRIDQSRAHAVS